MDVPEAAIAEDADNVPSVDAFADMFNDSVGVWEVSGSLAPNLQILHQARRVQPLGGRHLLQPRDFGDNDSVRIGERVCQLGLEDVAASGIRAGLKHRPYFLTRKLDAQRAQRLADSRGMMSEVIHHNDPAADPPHFHAAFDALE